MQKTKCTRLIVSSRQRLRGPSSLGCPVVALKEGGEIGLFITLVSKVLQQRFLICFYFDWLVHKVEFPNVSTTNCDYEKGYFCVLSLGMYINLSGIVLFLQIPAQHPLLLNPVISYLFTLIPSEYNINKIQVDKLSTYGWSDIL